MRPSPASRHRLRDLAVAAGAYAALVALLLLPLLPHLRTHILADDAFGTPGQSDAFNFLWNHWWTLKAVSLGRSPFFCDWVLPPTGVDLFYDTHLLVPTLLSAPLTALLGPVAGYNLMIAGMLMGAALAAFAFLRGTFGLGMTAALTGGAFFGFSPYFLFKAHAHPNLIGGAFWAAALGTLFHAWAKADFSGRKAAALAAFAALTFWTSLVESFLAGVSGAMVIAACEAASPRGAPRRIAAKLRFLAPAAAVLAVSLAVFLPGRATGFEPDVFPSLTLPDLLSFPRLSALFLLVPWRGLAEFLGVQLPLAGAVLAIVGFRSGFPHRKAIALILVALAVVTLDPGGVASRLIRELPTAEAFRVFGRFFPVVLLFGSVPVAAGLRTLAAGARGRIVLVPLATLWIAEAYPALLHPSPVKGTGAPAAAVAALDRDGFVLLFPSGPYLTRHDTWQVALDAPCVLTSQVAHRGSGAEAERRRRFPILYDPSVRGSGEAWRAELQALNVKWLLFEDRRTAEAMGVPGGAAVWPGGEVLVRLPDPGAR
jgi:hypothetical protein